MASLNFGIEVIEKLFPFALVIDANGEILQKGPSLRKIWAPYEGAHLFKQVFEIRRPANSEITQLVQQRQNEMLVFRLKNSKTEFMGQIIELGQKTYLLAINLVVHDADELTALNLSFDDFALQDPIFDYLMLLQTQKRAIRQADEANRKLSLAHQTAIKASQTKSQFLANMSHELRTPMNGILGMSSILLDDGLTEEQKDYVQTIVTSAESLLTLVNDILDLSKIEAGHINMDLAEFDLTQLIREVTEVVYPAVQKKNIDLQVIVDQPALEKIVTDRGRLRQVLLNLLGNAVKFTSKGKVCLKFDYKQLSENSLKLQFTVTDSGIGMTPETLTQIFSPFVQGDSSMTRKFEGTGLGLSICKKIVDALGGKIEVSSTPNVGSEFNFYIIAEKKAPARVA